MECTSGNFKHLDTIVDKIDLLKEKNKKDNVQKSIKVNTKVKYYRNTYMFSIDYPLRFNTCTSLDNIFILVSIDIRLQVWNPFSAD